LEEAARALFLDGQVCGIVVLVLGRLR